MSNFDRLIAALMTPYVYSLFLIGAIPFGVLFFVPIVFVRTVIGRGSLRRRVTFAVRSHWLFLAGVSRNVLTLFISDETDTELNAAKG
jgi:hypothetical protein